MALRNESINKIMRRSNTQILTAIAKASAIANDTTLPIAKRQKAQRQLEHNKRVLSAKCANQKTQLKQTNCFQSGGSIIYKSRKFVTTNRKTGEKTTTIKKDYVEVFESHLPKYHCSNCAEFIESRKIRKAIKIEIENGRIPFCRTCKTGKVTDSQGFRKVINS